MKEWVNVTDCFSYEGRYYINIEKSIGYMMMLYLIVINLWKKC